MAQGKHRVERIPQDWVDDVRRRVDAGRTVQDALRKVLTSNSASQQFRNGWRAAQRFRKV